MELCLLEMNYYNWNQYHEGQSLYNTPRCNTGLDIKWSCSRSCGGFVFVPCFVMQYLVYFVVLKSIELDVLLNGVARTLKKLRPSNGDYWIMILFNCVPLWEFLLKERICSHRERILSFMSSSLYYGNSPLSQ